MSLTKSYFWNEICANNSDAEEAEYQAWLDWREEQDEKEINWFPEYKLAHDGYEEIEPESPRILIDDDIPF